MTRIRHIRTLLLVFVSIFFSATPVHAEDIEIYLTSNEGSGANILLVIDTSGATHRNFPGTSYSEGGKTVDEIVYALQKVVDGLAGPTRIGVSSQLSGGGEGGAINYPVLQIDENRPPKTVSRVASPTGDATQGVTVAVVPTPTNSADVTWGGFAAGDVLPMPSILSTANPENVMALMLTEVKVPRYAKIVSAKLAMRTPTTTSGTTNNFKLRIAHERSATPLPYTATDDLSGRNWSLPFNNGGGSYNAAGALAAGVITVDVTSVLQSAVAETTWCGGNDLSLLIQGTDLATAPEIYSYRAETASGSRLGNTQLEVEWSSTEQVTPPATAADGDELSCMRDVVYSLSDAADDATETTGGSNLQNDEPTLTIGNVTTGPTSGRGDHVGGARFAKVGLPSGTKVAQAMLRGSITSVSGTGTKLIVKPLVGDVPPFDTAGSVSGAPVGASSAEVLAETGQFSVEITELVNEIFADSGWVAGGALGLRLERSGTGLSLHALDGGAASGLILNLDVLAPTPMAFASTVNRRDEMKVAVDEFSDSQGGGNNKPVTSYAEAARYMLGIAPRYGVSISHPDAFSASDRSDYLPPAERYDQCGGNHIVLVTHADSSGETFKADIDGITGTTDCPSSANSDAWTCAGVLSSYLRDGTRNPTGLPVTTHAISFAADADTEAGLRDVAEAKGGGKFYTSANAEDLAEKLSDLINQLTTTDASMAAPGVAVNQLNRFRHLDQLYYALFRPAEFTYWEGNLKRYRIDFSADPPAIVDENGAAAVDPDTGFFKDTSNSWWGARADNTDPNDGQNVGQGGAREELFYRTDARVVWTVDASPAVTGSTTATSAPAGVTAVALPDTVDATTSAAMGARLGMTAPDVSDPTEVQQRLNLAHGGWADPLHSEPRLVNFGFSGTFEEAVLDDSKQTNVAFITTNGGALHAVEPKTGYELFTFIPPEELLKTEKRFQKDQLNGADPQRTTYGLDGGITVWRKAKNDGSGQPEHVFLYMGQRRGGRSYYALDVSDIDTSVDTTTTPASPTPPTLMWKIEGGVAPFDKLGESWSQPTLAQIKLNGQKVPVLIFGGGYSATDHDTKGSISGADGTGNAIYIVNAYTGALIWSASNAGGTLNNGDMKWSIPASVSVVDINFDGVIDYLYAADLGGQIFRVDLNAENTGASSLAFRVVTLAKLGTSASGGIANHRRFHAPPVVALSRRNGETILQVALGSGYRSHPLDTQTEDRIYAVDDHDALDALVAGFTPSAVIYEGDLLDVTSNTSPSPSEFSGKSGWFIDLEGVGEKVLSAGAIADGVLYITTFLPETSYVNECQRVIGAAQLYGVNILDGSPALDPNNSGTLTRTTLVRLPGLPPSPQLLLGEGGKRVILIGTATVDQEDSDNLGLRKTRWYEVFDEAEAQAVLDNAAQDQ